MASIDELAIADDPARWEALGFTVADGICRLGGVNVRLAGERAGRGIIGWSLRELASTDLDGLQTTLSQAPPRTPAPVHPNGAVAIDHVVAMSPLLDRTVAALQAAGLDLRRIREQPTPAGAPRQAFFRLGEEILEVIQVPAEMVEREGGADNPARLWGLALVVADIERATSQLAPHAGDPRPAVQPGRTIVTLRRSAGLSVPLALMSPRPARDA